MHDTKQMAADLEALHMTADALVTVLEGAERLAAGTDPVLAHARALGDELANGLDVEAERLSMAA